MQVPKVPKFTVDIIFLTTAMNRGVSVVTVFSLNPKSHRQMFSSGKNVQQVLDECSV